MKKKRLFLGISLLACAAFMASCSNVSNTTSSASSTTSEATPSTTTEVTTSTSSEATPSTTTEVDPGTTTTTTTVDPVVSYTVTWYNEDGTVYASNSVNEGANIVAPNTPTKAADTDYIYTFAGWYTSKDGGEKVTDFGTASKDVSYYARFEAAAKITVSFMVEGNEYESVEIATGSKVNKPTNPTKTGYYLSYWALNGVEFDFNTALTENTTLTAVFEEVKETENVGFGGSYTSWATLFANSTRTDSKSRKILGATDTDEVSMNGFTFLGKALLDGGILNTNASTIKVTLPSDNASLNMSATWGSSSDSGVIRVYKDGTQIYESTTTYSKSNGSVSLELTGLDAGDYEIKAEKTTATGQAGLKVSTIYYSKVVEYVSVNYQLNNGETKEATTLKKGTTLSELPSLVKSGYKFLGWYTTSTFDAGTEFALTDTINSNITLYAKWQELTADMLVTISFNVNVAGQTIDSVQIEKGTALAALPSLDIDGYRFNKWFTDSNFQNEFNLATTTFDSDTTLYAEYIKTYTVTFLDNDGNVLKTVTVDDDTIISEKISKPYIAGYKFDYWYDTTTNAEVDITTTQITSDMTLRAHYSVDDNPVAKLALTDAEGLQENAYVTFSAYTLDSTTATDYQVYLDNKALDSKSVYLTKSGSTYKAYIFGIKAGNHTVNVAPIIDDEAIEAAKSEDTTIAIEAYDRSGYAHFGTTEGVGAYNNDGTLKDNAVVIYVTNATKNTVKATLGGSTYTGLVNILKNLSKSSNPVVIRLLDEIQTTQFNEINFTSDAQTSALLAEQAASLGGNYSGYSAANIIKNGWNSYSNDIANGITELTGLSSNVSYSSGEFDTTWNMCSISGAKNVTLEGVGTSAGIFQWGMTWSKCDSIEVKNLTFSDYTEDACSFEAGSVTANGNYWIHNNTFNRGKNNWDFSYEQDKHYGDGATDFKKCHNITSSYNVFNNCKKTGLIGGSNSQLTMSVTFHHNFYNTVGSRLPLGRQANMHIYNNYYYNCSTCQDIRANAFVLSEANYFEGCENPQKVTTDSTYTGTVIKSYNDYLTGCGSSAATVVTDRTTTLEGNCKPDGSTNYTNFDTNSSQFYYDSTNKKSNVTILNTNTDVKTFVPKHAGAGILSNLGLGTYTEIDPDVETFTVIFDTNGGSSVAAQTVVSGSTISSVTTTRSGYTFKGWCTDSGLTKSFDTSTAITADITLYAKWEKSSSGSSSTTATVLTLNSFTTETLSSNTTVGDLTVTIKDGKTIQIKDCDSTTIAGTAVTKYVYFGGGGSYSAASIQFSTTATANITVYYAGGSGRYAALFNSSEKIATATTATTASGVDNVVSYTFENIEAGSYALASNNSSLEFYAIVITY